MIKNRRKPKMSSKKISIGCVAYLFLCHSVMATKLVLSCPHGQISFEVELAQTPQECAKGLMNRETLGEAEGMFSSFPESQPAIMWMKNTPLSLDMLFMSHEGQILAIEENT